MQFCSSPLSAMNATSTTAKKEEEGRERKGRGWREVVSDVPFRVTFIN